LNELDKVQLIVTNLASVVADNIGIRRSTTQCGTTAEAKAVNPAAPFDVPFIYAR
jgi:hypothetical protein